MKRAVTVTSWAGGSDRDNDILVCSLILYTIILINYVNIGNVENYLY